MISFFVSSYQKLVFKLYKKYLDSNLLSKEILRFKVLLEKQPDFESFISYNSHKYLNNFNLYKKLHMHRSYKQNNWGFSLLESINKINPKKIFELASGNGKFLDFLNEKSFICDGVDLINPTGNPKIIKANIENINIEILKKYDLVISADFLEHLNLKQIKNLLLKLSGANNKNLHIIACYDDNNSHNLVLNPSEWAYIFSKYFKKVQINKVGVRKNNLDRLYVEIIAY